LLFPSYHAASVKDIKHSETTTTLSLPALHALDHTRILRSYRKEHLHIDASLYWSHSKLAKDISQFPATIPISYTYTTSLTVLTSLNHTPQFTISPPLSCFPHHTYMHPNSQRPHYPSERMCLIIAIALLIFTLLVCIISFSRHRTSALSQGREEQREQLSIYPTGIQFDIVQRRWAREEDRAAN
jgi:hypothetical protein